MFFYPTRRDDGFFSKQSWGTLALSDPQQKNRARLTPGPVNSCFYCLIFKRTFFNTDQRPVSVIG